MLLNVKNIECYMFEKRDMYTWRGSVAFHSGALLLPLHIIDQSCLEQQIPAGKQVVTDDVLIGSDCHSVTDTKRAENIQNLQRRQVGEAAFYYSGLKTCPQIFRTMTDSKWESWGYTFHHFHRMDRRLYYGNDYNERLCARAPIFF